MIFSVIIVSYENLNILIDCVESIEKYNDIGDELEVIVVDNSTTNTVFDYVRSNYSKIKIVKNRNRGFGEGNNVGAKMAKGEYLLFLNPDTILVEPIFEFATGKFRESMELAMFGVKLVDINMKQNMSFYYMDNSGTIYSQLVKLFNYFGVFLEGKMFVSGANMFIRRDVFFEAGMFDENIFMYYEEADITRRIIKINKKIRYFGDRKIIHLEGKTSGNSEKALERRIESLNYYCEKYNVDFDRRIRSEIRYTNLKRIVYLITRNGKIDTICRSLSILKEYRDRTAGQH